MQLTRPSWNAIPLECQGQVLQINVLLHCSTAK